MYKISIFNNGVETVIHYPDPNAPHVLEPVLTQKRGQASSLSFSMLIGSAGYDDIKRFTTLITAVDIRNNMEIFSGRIYSIKTSMTADSKIKKYIVCESEMNYLQDSNVGSVIYEDKTVQEMFQTFLNMHNSQVEDYKQIQLGNVTVSDWIFCTTSLETTLEAIQKYVIDSNKGYLQLRKVNNVKYLDYISAESSTIIDVKLGINMKELIVSDEQAFGTRIIPVGANDLTIESVNGGKNYIEDAEAVAKYGIIYKTVDYKDIEDDSQLMTQCQNDLPNYTKPTTVLDVTALDLNKLAGTTVIEPNSMDIGTTIHIVNPILEIDENYKIYEMDLPLDKPWNPKLVISNKSVTLTSQINNLQATTIRNDGTYSGVQIGSSFGLRVMGNSNKFTVNGDTFELVKNSDGKKLIYTDKDTGDIFLQDVTANKGTYTDIIAKDMQTASDSGNTIKFHDQYIDVLDNGKIAMQIGYFPGIAGPVKQIKFEKVVITEGMVEEQSPPLLSISADYLYIGANEDKLVATQEWVQNQGYTKTADVDNRINLLISAGATGTFTSQDGKTIEVTKGLVTAIS